MRRYFAVEKDATIYENFPTFNTGADEILEIGQQRFHSASYSGSVRSITVENKLFRAFLKFDHTLIEELLGETSSSYPTVLGAQYFLNLKIANAANLEANQRVEFHPVSRSWTEGTGYLIQEWHNPRDGITWQSHSLSGIWDVAGGDFISGSSSLYHEFGSEVSEVRLNITNQILNWVSGSEENNGWVIKLPDSQESSSISETNIKFFSKQTPTIHMPTIEVVWNTQTINTAGSGLTEAPEEYSTYVTNLKPTYSSGSIYRLRFGIRPRYILKSFNDRFGYGNQYFFPSESFVGIRDEGTQKFVIPFDDGSRISSDTIGSYYDLKIENMFLRRTYKVFIRTLKPWGYEVIDLGSTFVVK